MNGYYGYGNPMPPPPQKNIFRCLGLGVMYPAIHMGVMFFMQFVVQLIVTVRLSFLKGMAGASQVQRVMFGLSDFMTVLCNVITVLIVLLIYFGLQRSRETMQGLPLRAKEYFSLKKVKASTLWKTVLLAFCFYHLVSLFLAIVGMINSSLLEEYGSRMQPEGYDINWFWHFLGVVVMAPITEELIYRNMAIGEMRKGVNVWIAIVATSLIFGVVHGNFLQIIYAACMGILFGYLFSRFDSIYPSLVAHAVFNFIGFLYSLLQNFGEDNTTLMEVFSLISMILGILSLVGAPLLLIWVRRDAPKKVKKEATNESEPSAI